MIINQPMASSMQRLKKELLIWICEKHATNSPLTREILLKKALELRKKFNLIEFKCSNLWITTFLKSHGFSPTLTSCDGPVFDDYKIWINLLRKVITQYRHRDFFSIDEFKLLTNVSPKEVWPMMQSTYKTSKLESATVLLCCNASGNEKLPLLICTPYKDSEVAKTDDYLYCFNKNSEISDEVFVNWLAMFNERLEQTDRKILLLIHRNRIRASSDPRLTNIRFLFFPKDFPSNLQPLRREVFHYFKMIYRQQYAKEMEKGTIRRWGLSHINQTLLESWKNVPKELIISSFQKTSFRNDDYFLEFSNPDFWHTLKSGISFRKFVTFDDDLFENSHSTNPHTKSVSNNSYDLRSRSRKRITIILDDEEISETDPKQNKKRKILEAQRKGNEEEDRNSCIIIHEIEVNNDKSNNSVQSINDDDDNNRRSPMSVDTDVNSQDIVELNADNIVPISEPCSSNTEVSVEPPQQTPDVALVYESPEIVSQNRSEARIISDEIMPRNEIQTKLQTLSNMALNSGGADEGDNGTEESSSQEDLLGNKEPIEGCDKGRIRDQQDESMEKDNWAELFEHKFVFGPNDRTSNSDLTVRQTTDVVEDNTRKEDERNSRNTFTLDSAKPGNDDSDREAV